MFAGEKNVYNRPDVRELNDKKRIYVVNTPAKTFPRIIEYVYYVTILYSVMGETWGLSIYLLGPMMLAILAAFCVMRLGFRTIYRLLALPIGCGISFLLLQFFIHGESLMGGEARYFVTWLFALLIVQPLSLLDDRFFHRFALALFLVGLALLPYIGLRVQGSEFVRIGIERSASISNPNQFAVWIGFPAVYFVVVGIETKQFVVRVIAWLITIGCLYLIGLTVSRGTLLAFAVATIVAFRRFLKRGFLPFLFLIMLSWLIYESGIFDQIVTYYTNRGTEETGRLLVWPVVIDRILNSPLAGVGASNIWTYMPSRPKPIRPHNGFLYLGLASGVVPLTLFLAYWIRAALKAFRASAEQRLNAPFQLPLLIFAFLTMLATDFAFLSPWVIGVLCTIMAAGAPRRVRRISVRQVRSGETATVFQP